MKAIGPVLVVLVGALSAILLTCVYFACGIATGASAGVTVPTASAASLRAVAVASASGTGAEVQAKTFVFPSEAYAPPATFGTRDLTAGSESIEGEVPIEEYFLPLKEKDTLATLDTINSAASSPIVSITSIAISSDNTIIWYDHHEDGFENDVLNPSPTSSTEIWGDGDCSNGSVPGTACLVDTDDFLSAGTAIVLENNVPIPYTNQQWSAAGFSFLFDGGDKISASFPVAITRGGYPHDSNGAPLPLYAGAVEVLDASSDSYGNQFVAPVGGSDTHLSNSAFQQSDLHVMASIDGTIVTYLEKSGGAQVQYSLNAGESHRIEGVEEGDRIYTNGSPVQVHLLTGNVGSTYELRWYSLFPLSQWSNKAYTPVGSSDNSGRSESSVFLYNPSDFDITVHWNKGQGSTTGVGSILVPAGVTRRQELSHNYEESLTGYEFYTNDSAHIFTGLVVVDTVDAFASWQAYDWGHTLIPENQLASQVVIGDGRKCADPTIDCTSDDVGRNFVFVSPVTNAKFWVSYNGESNYTTYDNIERLNTLRLGDPSGDHDMSGAYIFATEANAEAPDSTPVDFVAVWGQMAYDQSELANQVQASQLDMVCGILAYYDMRALRFLFSLILINSFLRYFLSNIFQGNMAKGNVFSSGPQNVLAR